MALFWLVRRPSTLRGLVWRVLTIVFVVSLAIWYGMAGLYAQRLVRADAEHRPDWCALPRGPCPARQWAAFPDLVREPVELALPAGLRLRGWYLPAVNGRLVVMFHDYRGNASAMLPLAAAVNASGTGVLALDLPGHGRSDGTRVWLDLYQPDLWQAIWQHVQSLPEVEPDQVAVAGVGLGGGLALGLAVDVRPKPAMVLVSTPWVRLDVEWVAEHTGLSRPLAWWVWRRLAGRLPEADWQGRYLQQGRRRLHMPVLWLAEAGRMSGDLRWLEGMDPSGLWLRLAVSDGASQAAQQRQLQAILRWMDSHWPDGEAMDGTL